MNAPQALQLANKRIDELQQLADTQAQIINRKNDEIAQLRGELERRDHLHPVPPLAADVDEVAGGPEQAAGCEPGRESDEEAAR
jgi:hypothetical protein